MMNYWSRYNWSPLFFSLEMGVFFVNSPRNIPVCLFSWRKKRRRHWETEASVTQMNALVVVLLTDTPGQSACLDSLHTWTVYWVTPDQPPVPERLNRPASSSSCNDHSRTLHSHSYKYESRYRCMGSSKHKFTCIPMVAVHIDTISVRVRVTCEFHSYEQFLDRSCCYRTRTM